MSTASRPSDTCSGPAWVQEVVKAVQLLAERVVEGGILNSACG